MGRPARRAIRRSDVREVLERSWTAASRCGQPVLALIRKMLNFAVDQEWIDANPAAKMARPAAEQSPDRACS